MIHVRAVGVVHGCFGWTGLLDAGFWCCLLKEGRVIIVILVLYRMAWDHVHNVEFAQDC